MATVYASYADLQARRQATVETFSPVCVRIRFDVPQTGQHWEVKLYDRRHGVGDMLLERACKLARKFVFGEEK